MRIPVTHIDDDPVRTPSNSRSVQTDGEANGDLCCLYRCRGLFRLERAEFRWWWHWCREGTVTRRSAIRCPP